MGLLDELEQEAQRLKAGADDAERAKSQRDQVYRTRLEPGMVATASVKATSVVVEVPPT